MGEFTIRVKTLDGQTNEVTLVDTSTVLQLKELIEKKTQIATNRQKIIYRGRVLTDNLLLKDQADINGSAVHVVDSNRVVNSRADQARPQSTGSSSSSRSRNPDRPRGRERYRTSHRTSAAREGLRSRLYSMETWLARFEGSLTALDRGATPEDSRQFANEPEPPNPADINNPIPVTDLASIVNRAADSIERFPAALRRLHTFISDDPLLASRNSTEFTEARSLVQNAMDASRYLHQFAQVKNDHGFFINNDVKIFSSLIIPLGEVPPRNLNIIQQGNYRLPPNILLAPRNVIYSSLLTDQYFRITMITFEAIKRDCLVLLWHLKVQLEGLKVMSP